MGSFSEVLGIYPERVRVKINVVGKIVLDVRQRHSRSVLRPQ
jgi:hypothetical protein